VNNSVKLDCRRGKLVSMRDSLENNLAKSESNLETLVNMKVMLGCMMD
jgi:hypothetical protein